MTDQADTGPIRERETLSSLVAQRVAAAMADGPVVATHGLAHRREGGHWLVFNMRALSGPVTGCHCGFVAELDADGGWGDSVLDHFEAVVRAESLTNARLSDVPGLERQLRDKIAGEVEALRAVLFPDGSELEPGRVRSTHACRCRRSRVGGVVVTGHTPDETGRRR